MNVRLWNPQLDFYDCVRRLGVLIASYSEPPGVERLCIADFYLANPPLLHRSTMKRDVRNEFNALRIRRPEKAFLTYPSPALLFRKMEPVQNEALRAMSGKGLVSIDGLQRGLAVLTAAGDDMFQAQLVEALTTDEAPLIRFLTEKFAVDAEVGTRGLRHSSGLRRTT